MKPGAHVDQTALFGRVGDRPVDVAAVSHRIAAAFEIGDRPPAIAELVLGTVDQVDPTSFGDT